MQRVIALASSILLGFLLQEATSQWVDPTPQEVLWNLRDPALNRSCIQMAGTYSLLVPYRKYSSMIGSATVSISPNATITGTCGSNSSLEQSITLTWPIPSAPWATQVSNLTHTVTFTFSRNLTTGGMEDSEGSFSLKGVKAVLQANPGEFGWQVDPKTMVTLEAANLDLPPTPLSMSYYCSSSQDVPVGNGTLRLSNTQMEVFQGTPLETDAVGFGPKSVCSADGLTAIIWAVVLTALLLGAAGVGFYLFKKRSAKNNYTNLD